MTIARNEFEQLKDTGKYYGQISTSVMDFLLKNPHFAFSPMEIAQATGLRVGQVRPFLYDQKRKGVLDRRGQYYIISIDVTKKE